VARFSRSRDRSTHARRSPAQATREHDAAVLDEPEFSAVVQRALESGEEYGLVVASLGVEDLDGGSALLVAAESRVARGVRPVDVVGRLSGGRLAVLASAREDPYAPARIAERVADMLADPFHVAGREVDAQLAIGLATGAARTPEAFIHRAERAMATIR
jgi:predicted signal transduction protein with EAL and GGDEF domain